MKVALSKRDRDNADAARANAAYRESRGLEDNLLPATCSCGRDNCPGHGKGFQNYKLKEKAWSKLVDRVKDERNYPLDKRS